MTDSPSHGDRDERQKDSESQWADQSQAYFAQAKLAQIQAPPFTETQVLARLRERRQHKKRLWLLQWVSGISLAAVAALLVLQVGLKPLDPGFTVDIKKAALVKVDITEFDSSQVARAEIRLPNGVAFFTEVESLRQKSEISFPWNNAKKDSHFAFMVEGLQAGQRAIEVRFYNDENQLIERKTIRVKFIQRDVS